MGKTADEIVTDIDQSREELKANIEELEARAKDAADWRSQFGKHPVPMVLAALVGGMLLSALVGKR